MVQREERAVDLLSRLDRPWDAGRVEATFDRMQRRGRRRRLVRGGVGAVLVLVLGLAIHVALPARTSSPIAIRPSVPARRETVLGDGSTLTPMGEAHFVVREVSPDRVRVELDRGEVEADVARRPERTFAIEAGPVRVVVLGTRFRVLRLSDERARVQVLRGHVRVEWEGGSHDLLAGQQGIFPEQVAEPEPAPVAPRARPRARDWRESAQAGSYGEAYELIERGGARSVRDEVDDLLLAADAARLSGHSAQALPYLERAQAHRTDPRAPMAAFTRGRVLLSLSRASQAGGAFESALDLGAEGSLRENALARAVEAYGRAGDGPRAAHLARQYLEHYPHGRWASSVRAYGGLGE